MALTKTQQAVKLVKEKGVSQVEAAKRFGITQAGISKAIKFKDDTAKRRCPCCEQIVASGYKINKAVLK